MLLVLVTDMALLSSVAALNSVTSPDFVHQNMAYPLRWMTSLFPDRDGDGGGESSWWRPPCGLDVSTAASCAARR